MISGQAGAQNASTIFALSADVAVSWGVGAARLPTASDMACPGWSIPSLDKKRRRLRYQKRTHMEKINEAQHNLFIAEYNGLNSDIQRRLSDRFYLTFGVMTVAVSLMSVSGIPGYTLFIFPWACWLVSLWILHNEISIKRKSAYIRRIEADFLPKGYGFLSTKPNSGALSTDKLNIESIINKMIVGCELGTVAIGALRIVTGALSLPILIISGMMFVLALAGIWMTLRNDFARREKRLNGQKTA